MFRSITPQQAQELINSGSVEVVDVRDPGEWAGGHLAGAELLPLEQLRTDPARVVRGQALLFVCAAGVRSQTAARIAAGSGASVVYSLSGGTRAWVKAGFPLVNDLSVAV